MDKKEIYKVLNKIFIDVLDNDNLEINDESKAENIEEWDSLSHIHLIVEIENSFDLSFTVDEIQSWENVGEMVEFIQNKLN